MEERGTFSSLRRGSGRRGRSGPVPKGSLPRGGPYTVRETDVIE